MHGVIMYLMFEQVANFPNLVPEEEVRTLAMCSCRTLLCQTFVAMGLLIDI